MWANERQEKKTHINGQLIGRRRKLLLCQYWNPKDVCLCLHTFTRGEWIHLKITRDDGGDVGVSRFKGGRRIKDLQSQDGSSTTAQLTRILMKIFQHFSGPSHHSCLMSAGYTRSLSAGPTLTSGRMKCFKIMNNKKIESGQQKNRTIPDTSIIKLLGSGFSCCVINNSESPCFLLHTAQAPQCWI